MSSRPPLTAIVTTRDEERNIGACLASLAWCDEILLVDSHSTDRTVEIARSIPNVRVLERTYYGAASQKNWAMDRASHDWILIFDADERCPPALRQEIESLLAASPRAGAYRILRHTYFLNKRIRFSGWQNDSVVRLFRKGEARYPNRRVHADMVTKAPAPLLAAAMDHYMVEDLASYCRRIERYSYWGAAQLYRDGRRAGAAAIVGRSFYRFFRTLVLQGGLLDGMHGLVFCSIQSYGTFLKWATLWGWRQRERQGLAPQLPDFDDDGATWDWSSRPELVRR